MRKKCVFINVCKRLAHVQLTLSTYTCVCVDNGVPVLVTFFVTVLSINDHSTCGATRWPWIPRKACTADKCVLCCIPSLGRKESNVVICSFPSIVSTVCDYGCYACNVRHALICFIRSYNAVNNTKTTSPNAIK